MPQVIISTEDGMIHSIDRTQPDSKVPVFTLNAHDSSLSGIYDNTIIYVLYPSLSS